MTIHSIKEDCFSQYGREIELDFSSLMKVLISTECPLSGTVYIQSCQSMEDCSDGIKIQREFFGGLPVQIGYCNGENNTLNCLEYHSCNEINIAANDIILLLGKVQDIVNGQYNTENVKAFKVPANTAVELYSTTLHYAPCGNGFRVAVALAKGTNGKKDIDAADPMLWGCNKWLLAHPNSTEARQGAYIGLYGENIKI